MVDNFVTYFGETVDLDELYKKHIHNNNFVDHLSCIKELGYALYYMKYCYPERDWGDQYKRVDDLCKQCRDLREQECENFRTHERDHTLEDKWHKIWFKFYYKIEDEIENMC